MEYQEEFDAEAPTLRRVPLTKQNLRQLNKMTSKNADTESDRTPNTEHTIQTKASAKSRISTTETGFDERFVENGFQLPYSDKARHSPPPNLPEIRAYLNQSRGSASPTMSRHDDFIYDFKLANNERAVEDIYRTHVLKNTNTDPECRRTGYRTYFDTQWVDFDKDVGFNNGLSAPKPDITEGYLQSTFPPNVKKLGGAATLVKNNPQFVALPHFAVEFKAIGKDMNKAEFQAGYDGAAMTHARNKALTYLGEPVPERQASPLTMAVDGRNWSVYAHYNRTDKETNRVESYQVRNISLLKSGRRHYL